MNEPNTVHVIFSLLVCGVLAALWCIKDWTAPEPKSDDEPWSPWSCHPGLIEPERNDREQLKRLVKIAKDNTHELFAEHINKYGWNYKKKERGALRNDLAFILEFELNHGLKEG